MNKENPVLDKSFRFALDIMDFSELLDENKKFVLSKQLLRSGTSIGANIREAQSSESRQDFIHKFKIAAKEAEETEYWLLLCKHSPNYPTDEKLSENLTELKKLITSIIYSSKQGIKQ
jgi:four helix bundle protein